MKLGLPYMGSKRKLAKQIVDKIIADNPNMEHFYDLFGGGGAVSFEMASRGIDVYYNELNTGVVKLLTHVMKKGVTKKYYQWVTREEFMENKTKDNWLGGFTKVCWSFGNNQMGYMYGKPKEARKLLKHNAAVNKDKKALKELGIDVDLTAPYNVRRIEVCRGIHKLHGGKIQIQHLERINTLIKIADSGIKFKKIYNKSYIDVKIKTPKKRTVVYLDPPYKGTGTYEMEVDHKELEQYVQDSKYKIYMSGYDVPYMSCIESLKHHSNLSGKGYSAVMEKLYAK